MDKFVTSNPASAAPEARRTGPMKPEAPVAGTAVPSPWEAGSDPRKHPAVPSPEATEVDAAHSEGLGALAASGPAIQIRLEKTPAEFSHLYAGLERQVAGASALMNHDILGTDRPYVLGVTSAVVGEGKTTVALHLAMNAARNTFKKVCLIDLSLGDDALCQRLGMPSTGKGIINILEETDQTLPTLQLIEDDDLVIMPAGKAPFNASKSARSPRVAELIAAARQMFHIVIVDLPAVSTDNVLPLVPHMDGLLLVARAGATPKAVITRTLEQLGRNRVLGVTLNRVKSSGPEWLQKRMAKY